MDPIERPLDLIDRAVDPTHRPRISSQAVRRRSAPSLSARSARFGRGGRRAGALRRAPHGVGILRSAGPTGCAPNGFPSHEKRPHGDRRAPLSWHEEILASIAWFRRRYPTPLARLRAARRAYAQWAKSMPR
jgi:hypothetical protein